MFSSNQIFEISGTFGQLVDTLEFINKVCGMKLDAFQITKDGRFCLGWNEKAEGWEKFQFDYSTEVLASIIQRHIEGLDTKELFNEWDWDGSTHLGFKVENLRYGEKRNYEGIQNENYCEVIFSPFICFYAK